MDSYHRFIFPLLKNLDAERSHEVTLSLLSFVQRTALGRLLLRQVAGDIPRREVSLFGLSFPNVLGVAAGFDKNVRVLNGLALLGFGHVEVGTLTPWAQEGNPRPRIFRLPDDRALINRMGFPNAGVVYAVSRLRDVPRQRDFIVGVSLGKQKETPLVDAAADYVTVMRAVYAYADYLAVNVSSPNTPSLRELQGKNFLDDLLKTLTLESQQQAERASVVPRPLLLKIAPDLGWQELDEILDAALENGIDGIIATNTTTTRNGINHKNRVESGGLSGAPLAERTNEIISYIVSQTEQRLPVVGVGGVFNADDVCAKLDAGASLVQVYTGLVYEGPQMAGRILRTLAQRQR